ncbi:hypothetical protein MHYP_G00161960 [Metynnis hypsauchen]
MSAFVFCCEFHCVIGRDSLTLKTWRVSRGSPVMAEESSSSNVGLSPGLVSSRGQLVQRGLTGRDRGGHSRAFFDLSENDHEVQFDSESFVRCRVLKSVQDLQ